MTYFGKRYHRMGVSINCFDWQAVGILRKTHDLEPVIPANRRHRQHNDSPLYPSPPSGSAGFGR